MALTLPFILERALSARGLRATGGFAPQAHDGLGAARALILLSPGPRFWRVFTASYEYQGGLVDPLDRWSARVIGRLAQSFGADAYFPFGEEGQRAPFFSWAQRSGRAWSSPVKLLVGSDMGLNASYRGALGLPFEVDFGESAQPCLSCEAPCTTSCPAGALTTEGYDVPACKDYLAAHPESPCREAGCAVRRACPVSTPQTPAHAQFHMAAFLG